MEPPARPRRLVFALRARTSEAKAQAELAQLENLLPRLTRMWVHLSRIRGGIGLRGPGETQLETDRRMIRQKIGKLKKDLQAVAEHRQRVRERSRARGVVKVALIGYTNAGKSSLLRALTGAEAHVGPPVRDPGHRKPGNQSRTTNRA